MQQPELIYKLRVSEYGLVDYCCLAQLKRKGSTTECKEQLCSQAPVLDGRIAGQADARHEFVDV